MKKIQNTNKILTLLKTGFTLATFLLVSGVLHGAWSQPSCAPPECNVALPINASKDFQIKGGVSSSGGLSIGGLLSKNINLIGGFETYSPGSSTSVGLEVLDTASFYNDATFSGIVDFISFPTPGQKYTSNDTLSTYDNAENNIVSFESGLKITGNGNTSGKYLGTSNQKIAIQGLGNTQATSFDETKSPSVVTGWQKTEEAQREISLIPNPSSPASRVAYAQYNASKEPDYWYPHSEDGVFYGAVQCAEDEVMIGGGGSCDLPQNLTDYPRNDDLYNYQGASFSYSFTENLYYDYYNSTSSRKPDVAWIKECVRPKTNPNSSSAIVRVWALCIK
ncbi:MAG: hypothetical protein ACI9AR_000092 [Flavobacteriaceae bacterium]|jgi:hypothetical protein